MKRLVILTLAIALTACGTVTQQFNTIHAHATNTLKADVQSVKDVGVAAKNQPLVDCADAVLTDQIPAIEALDVVQVSGPLSTLALVDAKREALKIKPAVAQKCSPFAWMLGQLGLLGGK